MYEFTKITNLYFLLIAIIQFIPIMSPMDSTSGVMPLLVVVGVSMIREGIEDYNRYRSDVQQNSQ